MIAGISMYQPSSAGVHHHPPSLAHSTPTSELVGYQPAVELDNGTSGYDIQQQTIHHQHHQLHQMHQIHLYGSSSTGGGSSLGSVAGPAVGGPTGAINATHAAPAISSEGINTHDSASSNSSTAAAHHLSYDRSSPPHAQSQPATQQSNASATMMGLEQQFAQQFRIQQQSTEESNVEQSYQQNIGGTMHDESETNDTHLLEHVEGEDGDEEPVKLFVGQVRFD
jgi:hypothetical protein